MKLTKKLLTPAKFGLNTMKTIKSNEIVDAVYKRFDNLEVSLAVKSAMKHMIEMSKEGKDIFEADFSGLSGADVGILTSDFGEVVGAVYMLNSKRGYKAAKFPISESQKLVDYFLVKDGIDEAFSAKAGEGGAPSIIALEKKLQDIDISSISGKHKKALEAMKIISSLPVYEGVLVTAQFLNLPSYNALIKILRRRDLNTKYSSGIPKEEHLKVAIDSCGKYETCIKEFSPLFRAANFQIGDDATKMKLVFAGTAKARYKKWGLLHFPVTSQVSKWLNDRTNGATEILTRVASTLSINQIYLDHYPKMVKRKNKIYCQNFL